jgi:lysozyme family protein
MKHNWEEAFKHILKHEGGYVHHELDPGGRTNLGVTQRVWEEWTGKRVSEADMRALTPELVAPMYKKKYWDVIRGDDLPAGVDLCVFDAAVNAGVGRASKFLQQAVGVTADGQIGPKTISAVTAKPADEIIEAFCALREAHYKSLSTFETFGKGWMRRLASIKAESTDMA